MPAPEGLLDVSIIIPTRDGASRIARTIESVLRSMDASGRDCELVVVDSATKGELPALVAARWPGVVRCVATAEAGASVARNLGVRSSTGETVLFCDDDAVVPAGWVAALSAPLLTGTADLVGGSVRLAPDLTRPGMGSYHRGLLADTGEGFGSPPESVHGVSMGARRAVFDAGWWYHPELGAGRSGFMEEHAWFRAAIAAGFRATWVDSATVVHHPSVDRLDRAGWLSRARRQGASEALARALYSDDRITVRDLLRVGHALARRGRLALGDRGTAVPSEAYLRAVATAHHAVGFVRERRRHPVPEGPPGGGRTPGDPSERLSSPEPGATGSARR